MRNSPRASWAEVYDLADQRSFGPLYGRLMEATVELISEMLEAPARIVDFGAGTGRLSLPLARLGYRVTAVEPCREMLDRMQGREGRENVSPVCSSMGEFRGEAGFDLALCVFTVVLYLRDEVALKNSLAAAFEALRPGGWLILDVPPEAIFRGYSVDEPGFERTVTITPLQGGRLHTYREEIVVPDGDGNSRRYADECAPRALRLFEPP